MGQDRSQIQTLWRASKNAIHATLPPSSDDPTRLVQPRRRRAEEFVCHVRPRLGANALSIKLFGSKARGDAAPDSDLDVLIVVGDHWREVEDVVPDLAANVSLAHEVDISPRVIEAAVFEHPREASYAICSRPGTGRRAAVSPELTRLARHRLERRASRFREAL